MPLLNLVVPEAIQAIFDEYAECMAARDQCNERLDQIAAEAKGRFGRSFSAGHYVSCTPIYEAAVAAVVGVVKGLFSPEGVELEIDAKHFLDMELPEVWAALEEKYGGGRFEREAYKPVASNLRGAICREMRENEGEMRVIGGRIAIDRPACTTSEGLTCYSREELSVFVSRLRTVGVWSGVWSGAAQKDFEVVMEALTYRNRNAAIPRMTISDTVLIVPFKSKWEFRFAPSFVEKIQLFVSEYGEPLESD